MRHQCTDRSFPAKGVAIEPRTQRTLWEFQQVCRQVVPSAREQLSLDDRLDAILSADECRRVWQELRAAGRELPELRRPAWVVFLAVLLVSSVAALLVFTLRTWSALVALVDLGWLAQKLTRSWAVHPPVACETVREVVLYMTPFRHEDYRAGLWPREEIVAKVRLAISEATGIPFADIKNDSKLFDLIDC